MAAPNGINNTAGAAYGMGGGGMMPPASHHNDMQHVWSLVEQLSGVLQSNRERYDELQAGIARAQSRPPGENGAHVEHLGNGDFPNNASHQAASQTGAQLADQLATTKNSLESLEAAYSEQAQILLEYEGALEDVMQRLRNYGFEQQNATIAVHQHYNALLTASRKETMQAQLTHQAWQGSLTRVSEYVRLAMRENAEGSLPYRKRIAALKEENRLLRSKAGWEPASDSEEDEGLGLVDGDESAQEAQSGI